MTMNIVDKREGNETDKILLNILFFKRQQQYKSLKEHFIPKAVTILLTDKRYSIQISLLRFSEIYEFRSIHTVSWLNRLRSMLRKFPLEWCHIFDFWSLRKCHSHQFNKNTDYFPLWPRAESDYFPLCNRKFTRFTVKTVYWGTKPSCWVDCEQVIRVCQRQQEEQSKEHGSNYEHKRNHWSLVLLEI